LAVSAARFQFDDNLVPSGRGKAIFQPANPSLNGFHCVVSVAHTKYILITFSSLPRH
jgi:hypothetical protein